jgi:GcrA cell cycle regulator
MSFFPWTEENIAKLKKLHAADLGRTAISMRFGCTSNAIAGKLSRLGITKADRPKREEQSKPRQRKFNPFIDLGKKPAAPPLTKDQKEYILSSDRSSTNAQKIGKGIPLVDLAFDQCHWPINERKGWDEHLFCGEKAVFKYYCDHHARMAYQPPRGPVHVGKAA